MEDFIIRALIAGLAVAVIAAPLGSFMVWRRMSYFGDTLAHSSLLGVSLGVLAGVSINPAIIAVCMLVALLLVVLQRQRTLSSDTLLGIFAHSALSLGLIAISFADGVRLDLMGLLFGDILAISPGDLWWTCLGGVLVLLIIAFLWRPLLSITLHEDLARVEGVPVFWVNMCLMLLIALVIAVALKIVGILLITSLMIIPAASARRFARSPEQMAVFSAIIGSLSVVGGMWASLTWDTPAGPSIVVTAALIFTLTYLPTGFSAGAR